MRDLNSSYMCMCQQLKVIYFTLLLFLASAECTLAQPFYEAAGWTDIGNLTFTAFGWSMSNAGDINGDGFDDMVLTAIDYSNPPETNGEEGEVLVYYGSADGLSAEPDWQYESNNDSSVLGFSSDGGDINGDGFNDIVIGSLQWTGDQYNEGRIYLWYGSADGLSTTGPDWNLDFDQTYALLGSGVAMSGDINSDGYNDLFLSAKMWDNPEPDEGKVWLYWGSPDGPVASDWTWESDQEGAIAGFPVNYAGDVNGDGFDDVLIGVNQYDHIEIDEGKAVGFYGSATGLHSEPDWTAYGHQKKCNFGHWVDGAGDVNGDGFDDVVVAALLYESDSAEFNEGRIFVFNGGPDGIDTNYSWFGEINQAEANFGYSCAGAGDINGDGYDDVIGGAKYWTNPEDGEGGAFVWFGSEEGLKYDYCWKGEGDQPLGYYGRHVGGDGDFNGDGYSDFMVGAYRYTEILPSDGKAFVYYGAPQESQFHYAQDTFCIDDENPLAIIDGLAGGTFYSDNAIVDAISGEVNLIASGAGLKTIYYLNTGFCPVDSFRIYIQDAIGDEGIFHYNDYNYCSSAVNPIPFTIYGASGYYYSDEAIVDTETGAIDLEATGYGGPYTIYFSGTTAIGCEVIASDSIMIDYDASFYYLQDTFCIHQANPFPVIDDFDDGTFFVNDAGLEINEDNGKLVLTISDVGGPYTVYYNSFSTCPLDSAIVWLKDTGPADGTFSYASDTFCINETNPIPDIAMGTDGFFYSSTAIVNTSTGEIDLSATGAGSTHQIYFESEEICAIDSFAIYISDVDLTAAEFHFLDDTLCVNELNPIPLIDGIAGGSFYSDAIINVVTGEISLEATGPGVFVIHYETNDGGGCLVESTQTIYLFDDVDATMNYTETVFYQDEVDPYPLPVDSTGTFTSFPPGLVFADDDGTIDLDMSAVGIYTVYYTVVGEICTEVDSTVIQILPPCTAPLDLFIEELTATTAEISWSDDPYYTDYFVYLVSYIDSVLYIVEGANSIIFTDLIPESDYTVYVFTDCYEDTSANAAKVVFTLPVGITQSPDPTFKLYPNPADEFLRIEFENTQIEKLEIKSVSGELIYTTDHIISNHITISTKNFSAGIYFISIQHNNSVYFGSFVVE